MKSTRKGLLFSLLMLTSLLTGCSKDDPTEQYNAVLYDNISDQIEDAFKEANPIELYDPNDPNGEEKTNPNTRTFLIEEEDTFNSAFIDDSELQGVDFTKQIVILYTLSSNYTHPAYISKMEYTDKVLTIQLTTDLTYNTGSAVSSYQRWEGITLDKLEIDTVNFKLGYNYHY